jgi:hypothetical protein
MGIERAPPILQLRRSHNRKIRRLLHGAAIRYTARNISRQKLSVMGGPS